MLREPVHFFLLIYCMTNNNIEQVIQITTLQYYYNNILISLFTYRYTTPFATESSQAISGPTWFGTSVAHCTWSEIAFPPMVLMVHGIQQFPRMISSRFFTIGHCRRYAIDMSIVVANYNNFLYILKKNTLICLLSKFVIEYLLLI